MSCKAKRAVTAMSPAHKLHSQTHKSPLPTHTHPNTVILVGCPCPHPLVLCVPPPFTPANAVQAEVAEGMWVTDEFESEAYEMGNLESVYGMYLWDK